ncbi:MAG TPA: hypothetical protein VLT59_04850, partial [Steroidobacteraceae bacterium]|nr:hypothetical protein [Steroidobacteraceae bacterium]
MRKSWMAWLGVLLGAVALAVAAVQVAAGPFDPEPPLDEVVADTAKSVYERLRRFTESDPAVAEEKAPAPERTGVDRSLRAATAGLGAVAVSLAFAGFSRREDPRACGSAAVLGVAAMPLALSLGVLVAALMVAVAARLLPAQARDGAAVRRDLAPAEPD